MRGGLVVFQYRVARWFGREWGSTWSRNVRQIEWALRVVHAHSRVYCGLLHGVFRCNAFYICGDGVALDMVPSVLLNIDKQTG